MNWYKNDRCKMCKDERAIRYCLRNNKDIGWSCCNGMRPDGKCPSACAYTPRVSDPAAPLPELKSDSRTEFLDFLDRYLQFWINIPLAPLGDKTPAVMSQTVEGRGALVEWLSRFSYNDSGVLRLLKRKLNLELSLPSGEYPDPEQLTKGYFEAVIAQDWDVVLAFHLNDKNTPDEVMNNLIDQLTGHAILKKTHSARILNAGFTEDSTQSFVFYELNGKENWTLVFASANGLWRLVSSIHGILQDYYAQKHLFRQIAVVLNQPVETSAFNLIHKGMDTYLLCPDLFYYQGLYLVKTLQPDTARLAFKSALSLEPEWQEPKFQLALLELQQKNFQESLEFWLQLAEHDPTDLNVQNNIGVCYMGMEQPEKAKQVWSATLDAHPEAELIRKNLDHLNNE